MDNILPKSALRLSLSLPRMADATQAKPQTSIANKVRTNTVSFKRDIIPYRREVTQDIITYFYLSV